MLYQNVKIGKTKNLRNEKKNSVEKKLVVLFLSRFMALGLLQLLTVPFRMKFSLPLSPFFDLEGHKNQIVCTHFRLNE